ncbi:MAG: PilZ domain-containing protein [Gammaproteobacteria bacterium]
MPKNRRASPRHLGGLAIRCRVPAKGRECVGELRDVGLGGFGLRSGEQLAAGQRIEMSLIGFDAPISFPATVLWCRSSGCLFQAGAHFEPSVDAFQARMLEQICYIEAFRRQIYETTGRLLSRDGVALEWIRQFASRFPSL